MKHDATRAIRRYVGAQFGRAASVCQRLRKVCDGGGARDAQPRAEDRQALRVIPWVAAKGDKTLRLEYDLTETSTVLDVGGYEGQWASDIFAMYRCPILVFEPVERYARAIRNRFAHNPFIKVYQHGLAANSGSMPIGIDADSSSVYKPGAETESISIVQASEFLTSAGIGMISLMKVNIEGGEYDLLNHLIDTGWIRRIENVQVQFHDFVPDAERRMAEIQSRLRDTHALTYQYSFVWENWRIHSPA